MVTLCLQCGDKGFSNAFVYCVKCLKFAVHRYCLDEIPKTFDEFVDWVCDGCELGLPRTASALKPKVTNFEERGHLKNQETVGGSGRLTKPILSCRNKKRKRPLVAKKKFRLSLEQIDEADEDAECSSSLSIELKEKEFCASENTDNGIQSAEKCAELELTKTSDKESFSENSEDKLKKAKCLGPNTIEQGSKDCLEICVHGQAHLENASALSAVEQAKPFADPIWSGSFFIMNKDYDAFDGLAAHLSTSACSKARDEAELFPALLLLEMYPKAVIWPKSFKTSEPSDNIALYFFAHDQRYGKLFDQLVSDMMSGKLALMSILQNAELLIFTSHELPRDFQRFHGKFYLWGVFRAKKARSSS